MPRTKGHSEVRDQPTWHDSAIFYALVAMVFVLPLVIFRRTADIFELPKVTLLRAWVLSLLLIWAIKVYQTKNISFRRTPLDLPVAVYGVVATASTIFSQNPTLSLAGSYYRYEGFFTIIAYFLIFFAATQFLQWERLSLLMYALLASVSLNAIYGIFQHYGYDVIRLTGKVFDLSRSSGAQGNPIFLGALLVITICLPLAKGLQARDLLSRIVFFSIFGLLAIAMLFTSTRGAWLGFAVAVTVLALVAPKRATFQHAKIAGLVLVLLFIMSGLFLTSRFYSPRQGTAVERVLSIFELKGSAATRLDMWKGSLELISDRPLLGSGWETFEGTFPRYATRFLMGQEELPDRPHNQLLYIAASAGLSGMLTYLWVAVAAFLLTFRSLLIRRLSREKRVWLVAVLAGVSGYLVQEQFSISSAGVTPVFWLFLGILARESSYEEKILLKRVSPYVRVLLLFSVGITFFAGSTANFRLFAADAFYRTGVENASSGGQSSLFRRAVELNPYVEKYRIALAQVYVEEANRAGDAQKLERAILVYEEGLRLDPRNEGMWIQVGDLYLWRQDGWSTEKAALAYRRALDIHPFSAGARWALGDLYLQQRRYKAAIRNLEMARSLVPRHTGILGSLATAYGKIGKDDKAMKMYSRILEIEPENERAKMALEELGGK